MHCRDFRKRHLAFLDHTLSDAELVAMQRHLAECECCARRDTAVRRGLLVFRNLPLVEPSADFTERLNAKLRQCHRAELQAAAYHGPGVGTFVAATAGVLAAGLAAIMAFDRAPARDLALPPVVATRPEPPPPPLVDQTVVTSASAGMPVWPAALIAEQAPVHFLSAEPQLARWSR